MTDEKTKVKDLAGELGLQNKDVLAAAKEMGIAAAKVAGSSLSEAEVSRLRAHFAPEPEKREDVIVRRRRKTSDEAVSDAHRRRPKRPLPKPHPPKSRPPWS